MTDIKLTPSEFMLGVCNAPFDRAICDKCGGTGLVALMCCSGADCGCRGMPHDFKECKCGVEIISDKDILKWAKS